VADGNGDKEEQTNTASNWIRDKKKKSNKRQMEMGRRFGDPVSISGSPKCRQYTPNLHGTNTQKQDPH
jgi:hypothetical protein